MNILVLNAGSSSLKCQLIATDLERIRENLALTLTGGRVPLFTVSFGLTASRSSDTFEETVARADHALLDAKTAGRNRVVVAEQPAATVTIA